MGKCYECKYCYTNSTMPDVYICVNGNSSKCGDFTGLCCEDECDNCVRWGSFEEEG